jgi:hypothetical protein
MSNDLTTYLLLSAAGAVMVGITAPTMFKSSQAAAGTFQNQVRVLENGAGGGGGATSLGSGLLSGNFHFDLGESGLGVDVGTGRPNGITGNVTLTPGKSSR